MAQNGKKNGDSPEEFKRNKLPKRLLGSGEDGDITKMMRKLLEKRRNAKWNKTNTKVAQRIQRGIKRS